MKVTIIENKDVEETEVKIYCKQKDAQVDTIVSSLNVLNQEIIGKKDDANHVIPLYEIYYFESVDEKVFCYTDKETFEVKYRLYEIEEALGKARFIRIGISMILNVAQVDAFKSSLNGRMEARLKNGESVEISRSYVPSLRRMLGGQ